MGTQIDFATEAEFKTYYQSFTGIAPGDFPSALEDTLPGSLAEATRLLRSESIIYQSDSDGNVSYIKEWLRPATSPDGGMLLAMNGANLTVPAAKTLFAVDGMVYIAAVSSEYDIIVRTKDVDNHRVIITRNSGDEEKTFQSGIVSIGSSGDFTYGYITDVSGLEAELQVFKRGDTPYDDDEACALRDAVCAQIMYEIELGGGDVIDTSADILGLEGEVRTDRVWRSAPRVVAPRAMRILRLNGMWRP